MPEVVDDLFHDNTPAIVDCDILEAAKENVQPLAAGRRVTALSSILATPHAARDAKLSATRNRLRINVELALDDPEDDPLEAYCRLVYWTVDNYPQGQSAESGLLELLEEATRVLKDHQDGVYRGELKYLKLWVLYATFVEKPAVIFKFLLVNDIGTSHSLFYEDYALALERGGSRSAADKIYALGVARQAEPSERLQARYREFQKRMITAAPLPAVTPPTSQPSAPAPKRVALRTTAMSSSSSVSSINPAPASARSNGRLQVFVDPSGEGSAADGNEWSELGSRKTRIKENVPETQKMVGTKIKQSGKTQRLATAASGSSSSKFVPFRDPSGDDSTDMPPPSIIPSSKAKGKAKDETKVASSKAGFVPFMDDPAPTRPKSKGAFVPFQDEAKPRKPTSKAAFVPFQDEDAKPPPPPATPAKVSFVPFKDEDHASFTPLRDEPPSTTRPSAPDSVMKAKKAGHHGSSPTTEAEALRKDPLKNYGSEADLGDDGLP